MITLIKQLFYFQKYFWCKLYLYPQKVDCPVLKYNKNVLLYFINF